MSGTDDVDHVEVMLCYQPVEVDIQEVQPGRGAPVPKQPGFHVIQRQWHFEQRIVPQIDLADREIIGGAPVGIHFLQKIGGEGTGHSKLQTNWLNRRQGLRIGSALQ